VPSSASAHPAVIVGNQPESEERGRQKPMEMK
jgi:hypothetical protein